MAISFVGFSQETYQTGQTTEPCTLYASSGINQMAFALLSLFEDVNTLNAAVDTTVNQSYTERVDGATGYNGTTNGEETQLSVASKILVGSDVAPTFTIGATKDVKGAMVGYSGNNLPLVIEDVQAASGRSTTPTSPAVTFTSSAGKLIVIVTGWAGGANGAEGTFTQRSPTTGAYIVADKTISASGSTGTFAHSYTSLQAWVAVSVALAETAAAGGTPRLLGSLGVGI